MKIEERLNRLEVNQMHIIHLLQTLMERLPEKNRQNRRPQNSEANRRCGVNMFKPESNTTSRSACQVTEPECY